MSETSRVQAIIEAALLVRAFFGEDAKTRLWFATRNPLLGGWSPNHLLVMGREHAVLAIVRDLLAENEPPTQPPTK